MTSSTISGPIYPFPEIRRRNSQAATLGGCYIDTRHSLIARATDTGLEHGPQTYLQAVASRAAVMEGFGYPRYLAIERAFATASGPYPAESVSGHEWMFVRRVLEAGDHAADLAQLAAR